MTIEIFTAVAIEREFRPCSCAPSAGICSVPCTDRRLIVGRERAVFKFLLLGELLRRIRQNLLSCIFGHSFEFDQNISVTLLACENQVQILLEEIKMV